MPIFYESPQLVQEKIRIIIPCFGIIRLQTLGKQWPIVLLQIYITCLGIFHQFLYTNQEYRLNIGTLKNGTSSVGLYGSPWMRCRNKNQMKPQRNETKRNGAPTDTEQKRHEIGIV